MHIPFNYNPFSVDEEDSQGLGPGSDPSDLYREVVRLRDDLATANKTLDTLTNRLGMMAEAIAIDGKPVLVVKFKDAYPDLQEDLQALAKMWQKVSPVGHIVCIPSNIQLESLDDADLSRIGLKRANVLSDRDVYDRMLRGK